MSCQDEAHGHDHEHDHGSDDHGHGGHGDHSHSHEVPLEAGPQDSLYPVIDVVHVTAMNAVGGAEAGQKVIKWVRRRLRTPHTTQHTWNRLGATCSSELDSSGRDHADRVPFRSWDDRDDETRASPRSISAFKNKY
jgi:hypothetical protein